MADEQFPREDELEGRQAAGVYPVGRVLRATFDAENHDSLGTDLTGLMLQLARIDPEETPVPRVELPLHAPPVAAVELVPGRVSWWRAVLGRMVAR